MSQKKLKNYTTKVPVSQSVREIQDCLVQHGATGFMLKYEKGTGRIESLHFLLDLKGQEMAFSLPVNWRLFQAVLQEQGVSRAYDEDYCYRVAWRDIRDWIDAQMALYETAMVSVPQIFLPYMVTNDGLTLFDKVAENPQLLLKA